MASGGTCALLLRAAALGGLTAAAWLLSGAVASASPADTAPDTEPLTVPVVVEANLLADPAGWTASLTESVLARVTAPEHRTPVIPDEIHLEVPEQPPAQNAPEDDGPALDFSGGSSSDTERSGQFSNEAPAHVIAAKAEARAARIAAMAAAAAPPPAPVTPPAPPAAPKVQSPLPAPASASLAAQPPADTGADWTVPQPSRPLHVPQPAPACTAPSVSSGHQDNSGGTRGVLAVLASHSAMFPPTTWTVEERTDGRVPGSLPGLPSTSPD